MTVPSPLASLALTLASTFSPAGAWSVSEHAARDFPRAAPESLGYSSERLAAVVEVVGTWVDEGRIAGGELLVIADGRTILHEAVGWRDRDREWPMARDTIFRLQSMTKPVLATVALMLVEDGVLGLDESVFKYLEEFETEILRDITVRQLLMHTAGLDYPDYNKQVWRGEFTSRRQALATLVDAGPMYTPGQRFVYANGNSDTLAEVIERAAGVPAQQLIRERVLDPLDMHDSRILAAPLEERGERYASAYVIRDEGLLRYWDAGASDPATYFRGAGGLCGTAMDFARFLSMWMDGGRVGARQLLSETVARDALSASDASHAAGGAYGMGWLMFGEPPEDKLIFGHDGSDGTIAVAVPDRRLVLAYFTQTRATPTLIQALELLFNALAPE